MSRVIKEKGSEGSTEEFPSVVFDEMMNPQLMHTDKRNKEREDDSTKTSW